MGSHTRTPCLCVCVCVWLESPCVSSLVGVLWYINPCELFSAKSCFIYIYIYIREYFLGNLIIKPIILAYLFLHSSMVLGIAIQQ